MVIIRQTGSSKLCSKAWQALKGANKQGCVSLVFGDVGPLLCHVADPARLRIAVTREGILIMATADVVMLGRATVEQIAWGAVHFTVIMVPGIGLLPSTVMTSHAAGLEE